MEAYHTMPREGRGAFKESATQKAKSSAASKSWNCKLKSPGERQHLQNLFSTLKAPSLQVCRRPWQRVSFPLSSLMARKSRCSLCHDSASALWPMLLLHCTHSFVSCLDRVSLFPVCRYELWCIAKGAKSRYCCIHCDISTEECRSWNDSRTDVQYKAQVFEDLAGRFETPDSRNRWENPLFRIKPGTDGEQEVCTPISQHVSANQLLTEGKYFRQIYRIDCCQYSDIKPMYRMQRLKLYIWKALSLRLDKKD